jgi:hypothetical protein
MPVASRSRILRVIPIGIDPRDSSAVGGTAGALKHPELMSEGKNFSLQRCSSLKGLHSRRKRRDNDREHVAEKLPRRLPKFNQFSQNGFRAYFTRDK